MLRRFLKDDIDGVRVTIFKLAYIHDTTHNSHKTFGKFFHDVQYMQWRNQQLELQQWEDQVKYKITRIFVIWIFVSCNNPLGYKEHVIYFIVFDFGEGGTIIY